MRRDLVRRSIVILALTGALAPVGAASGAPLRDNGSQIGTGGDAASPVWRLLLPPAKSEEPTVSAVSASIVRLGAGSIPEVVAILVGESVEPSELADVHPRAIELRREILIASLRGFPANQVVDHLRAKCASSDALDARIVAIQVLGEIGGARALEAVLSIASSIEPIHWMRTYVQMPIEESLAQILSRDPRLTKSMADRAAKLDPHLCPIAVRATVRAGSPVAVSWLVPLFGRGAELDLAIVEAIVHFAEQSYVEMSASEVAKVRSLLDNRDARVQRAAVTALGTLGDMDSISRFVAFLGSQDPLVARAAHWSLKRLTGQSFEADRGAWGEYLTAEQTWHDENWAGITDALNSEDLGVVADAVASLTQHPVYKNRAALELRPLLSTDDLTRVRLAAGALGSIGARAAVPWLVDCLRHSDETVRSNAWQSLRALTGKKLPPDPESWTELASS